MKSRKGFTLIEMLVVGALLSILTCIIVGVILFFVFAVKGCNAVDEAIETAGAERIARLESNPPKFAVGDIVYHKATDAKMVVAKNDCSWNEVKEGWKIKVKDGGAWDKIGGFYINENEVKATLEIPDKVPE